MYHLIEFVADWWADLERGPRQPLEQVLIRRGARRRAQVRPHVVEREGEPPVETADLFFEDGTATRGVPFAAITFPD